MNALLGVKFFSPDRPETRLGGMCTATCRRGLLNSKPISNSSFLSALCASDTCPDESVLASYCIFIHPSPSSLLLSSPERREGGRSARNTHWYTPAS